MTRVVITAAVNGPTTHRGQCPAVPFTPQEIGAEAQRAWEAGASVVHVHAREDGGAPSYRAERWREVVAAVRERCPALVSVSTGLLGVGLPERLAPLEARPDLATVPVGTMTYARYNPNRRSFDFDYAFTNPFADVLAVLGRMREQGVSPIVICSDLGHVEAMEPLHDMGAIGRPVPVTLLLGVSGGIAPTTHNLCRLVEAVGRQTPWQVASMGARAPWRLLAGAVSLGGGVRVGFQDAIHLPDGDVAESNGTLVAAAASLVRAVGLEPATVDDARELLLG